MAITATYDGLSRLTSMAGGASFGGIGGASIGAVTRTYAYDAYDNLIAANDNRDGADTAQTSFTYDQENRVTSQVVSNLFGTGAVNATLAYEYDELDRRRTLNDNFISVISYAYDPVDRLNVLITPQGDLFEKTYDLAGRPLTKTAPNITDKTKTYEPDTGRLSAKIHRAGGNVFNEFVYEYTARGNLGRIDEGGTVVKTRAYTYDGLERLTELDVPSVAAENETYTLDEEGNRLTSHLSLGHVTNEVNRLTEDDQFTYVYDLNGNLIAKNARLPVLSSWSYVYDAFDELIEVYRDGTLVEAYQYDALGRRSRIITAAANGLSADDIGIVNDNDDRYLDLRLDGTGTSVLSIRYVHGDQIDYPYQFATYDGLGLLTGRFTYHSNHQGAVRFVTDEVGNIANEYDYDSYGNHLTFVETAPQPFQYTGREWNIATRLYHYRARAYDPETGRFNQEDPIHFDAGDLNIYRYVGNNPINLNDPSGMVAAASTGNLGSRSTKALTGGGAVATAANFSTAARTAATLQNARLATLSRIAGNIACNLFTISDALRNAGAGTLVPEIGMCRVRVKKKPRDDTKPNDKPIIWAPYPPGGGNCSCNCSVGGVDDANTFRFARATAKTCAEAARTSCKIAINRLSIGVANMHHAQAVCSDGSRRNGSGGFAGGKR